MSARPSKEILQDIITCAGSWEDEARLIGNVTAWELYLVAHEALTNLAFEPDPKLVDLKRRCEGLVKRMRRLSDDGVTLLFADELEAVLKGGE